MPYLNRLTNMHYYPELDKGHVTGSKARTICVRDISPSIVPQIKHMQSWHFLMYEVHCVCLSAWSKPH